MHALYNLAVGPLAWLAFAVFILGSIYRLLSMRALALKKDGPFLTYISWPHAIKSLTHWLCPFGALGWKENPGVTVATFVFHLCLFLVPLFLMSLTSVKQLLGDPAGFRQSIIGAETYVCAAYAPVWVVFRDGVLACARTRLEYLGQYGTDCHCSGNPRGMVPLD